MAALGVILPKVSCASLENETSVSGLAVAVTSTTEGRATPTSPEYCDVQGTIAQYIGFQVLLPTQTWRQRYLQLGCSALCGTISLGVPQSTGYSALAGGYFVIASDDQGHTGSDTAEWGANATQRVDFAYLADHDTAVVAKGLASDFYSQAPRYSYFDGCSQGGHEALTEVQRYPNDFNGVLTGAPASIMTELNSLMEEWAADANISSTDRPIVTTAQTALVHQAVLSQCGGKVGVVLDFRSCAQTLNLTRLSCHAATATNCLTPAQLQVFEKEYSGPAATDGQHLFPGGFSPGAEVDWPFIGSSSSAPQTPGGFMASWLQYVALGHVLSSQQTADESFSTAFFDQIERLAPLYDATDPDLGPLERAGGKLLLWQGEADQFIPTNSSLAYYQAVVSAMGGLSATQSFARYYLLPGVGHCGGGAPDTFAGLSSVVTWAETGSAPGPLAASEYGIGGTSGGVPGAGGPGVPAIPLFGASPGGTALRTIELYPYPEVPQYKGTGSVNAASSFEARKSAALMKVIPWLGHFDDVQIWCNASGVSCTSTS
jgi:hypothetical protein